MAKAPKLDIDDQPIVWHEIDPATLTGHTAKAWQAYKTAYAAAKEHRDEFEALLRKEAKLPAGRRLVIAYNFGKLSVSNLVDTGTAKTSRKAGSLSAVLGGK